MGIIAYLSTIITLLGLFLIIASRHDFFAKISSSLRQLPGQMQQQFTALVTMQVKNNPLFQQDLFRISKELTQVGFRLRGKSISFQQFITFSFCSAIVFGFLSLFLTTRQFPEYLPSTINLNQPFLPNTKYVHSNNIPADILMLMMGFVVPRFLLLISYVKTKYKYQLEASSSLYLLTNSIRIHPNIDRAILDAVPRFPSATRNLFELGLHHLNSGDLKNINHVLFWVANETQHQYWKEFANIVMTEKFTGLKDRVARLMILTNRSDESHAVQIEDRKGLKWQVLKVGIPTLFLIGLFILLTFFDKADGYYLYMTPMGKLLVSLIYLVVLQIILLFTWNYYKV